MKFYMTLFNFGVDPFRVTSFSHSFCLLLEVLIILGHHLLYFFHVADYFHICVSFSYIRCNVLSVPFFPPTVLVVSIFSLSC